MSFLGLSRIAGRVIGFALVILLARYLGEEGFGQFTYAFSWVAIGNIIANFGIHYLMVREVARNRGRAGEYFAGSLTLKICIALITMIVLVGLNIGMGVRGELLWITAIFLLLLPFQMILSSCDSIFQAYERMGLSGVMDVVRVILTLFVLLAILPWGLDMWGVAFVYLGSVAFVSVCFFWVGGKMIRQPLQFWRWGGIIQLAQQAIPFVLISVVFIAQERSSIILLGWLRDVDEVGRYGAAYELIIGLSLAAGVISQASYPVLSRTWVSNRTALNALSDTVLKYLVLLGVGMAAGLCTVAPEVIELVYGSAYKQSTTDLRILAIGIPLFFQREILGAILTAIDRLRSLFFINLIALLVNVLGGWVFISAYGHGGAAVISVIASSLAIVGCVYAAPRELRMSVFAWYPRACFSGFLMVMGIITLSPDGLFLKVGIGLVMYLAALFLLGCLTRDEMRQFRTSVLSRG